MAPTFDEARRGGFLAGLDARRWFSSANKGAAVPVPTRMERLLKFSWGGREKRAGVLTARRGAFSRSWALGRERPDGGSSFRRSVRGSLGTTEWLRSRGRHNSSGGRHGGWGDAFLHPA